MNIFLQMWGGICYLLNKIFLSRAEGSENDAFRRKLGWGVYLLGAPAWIAILAMQRNWIAASIELGGIPAMALGFATATENVQAPKPLKVLAKTFAYGTLAVGIAYSLVSFGGITSFSQILEMGVMAGFLVGTYLLAREHSSGWLWFMLMNASMGMLMATEGKWILGIQQAVSLLFVISGFRRSQKSTNRTV